MMKLLLRCQILGTLFFGITTMTALAQESFSVNSSSLQKVVPSVHGLNLTSQAGVLFSNLNYGDEISADNNYLYGNLAFPNQNFSIGIDVNSMSLNQLGLKKNDIRVSYAYKLKIGYDTYLLGGFDVGITSQLIDPSQLVFNDQLNLQLGAIVGTSIDPLAQIEPATNYLDIGVSGLLYSEKFLVGLHIAHLNSPNISFNKETEINKDIGLRILGAIELDINPYGRGILPENTFLFGTIYGAFNGETTRYVTSQEIQLSNISFGLMQSLVNFNQNSSLDFGVLSTLSLDKFLLNLSYSFQPDSEVTNSSSIFEIGLRFNFDRFSSNKRGYYKRLNTYNF